MLGLGVSVMGEGDVELKLSSPKSMSETSLRRSLGLVLSQGQGRKPRYVGVLSESFFTPVTIRSSSLSSTES